MTKQSYFWATPSGPINLMKAEDMPVKPEFKGDYFLHYGPQKAYELALQAAKESSVLIQDQEIATKVITDHLKEAERKRCKTNRGSSESPVYSVPRKEYMEIKPDTIYGPFTVGYRIESRCCANPKIAIGACERDCDAYTSFTKAKGPSKVAILHDDTPEKEPQPIDKYNLLPCPFCGSQPEWINEAIPDSHFYIKCPNCHIVMKEDRRDKVIGMWNTRSSQ